jgi:hypothetical protein
MCESLFSGKAILLSIAPITRVLRLYKCAKHTGVCEKRKVALIELALLLIFTMLKALLIIFNTA